MNSTGSTSRYGWERGRETSATGIKGIFAGINEWICEISRLGGCGGTPRLNLISATGANFFLGRFFTWSHILYDNHCPKHPLGTL